MPVTRAVLDVLGEVALLLWGVHMVSSGVLRAAGGHLRLVLGRALRNRVTALGAGLLVTVALQSSTATALMANSFTAAGALGPVPGLAAMLGANVGTALVAWLLAFDVTLLFPVLLLLGLVLFRSASGTQPRNVGRALIGLGLMLLALHLLVLTLAPDHVGPRARDVLAAMTDEPLLVLTLAALLTWLLHSSVATVLLITALAQAGLVGPMPALAMVLGANLGSALNPLVSAVGGEPAALRLPLGNLANRLFGCIVALPFLADLAPLPTRLAAGPAGAVVLFHLAFNLVLALLFLAPLPLLARLLTRLLPDRPRPDDPATPRYLDRGCLGTPAVALAAAARETLRMADVLEAMLHGAGELLDRDDLRLAVRLRRMDDVLDRLHRELKEFLAGLAAASLSETERRRMAWILIAALNLEHAGDVVDKGLLDLAAKRIRRRQRLTRRELAQSEAMLAHLLAQLRLATAVFMGEDVASARRLVEQKERFREFERTAIDAQLARVEDGRATSETSGLHLDLVRELKRIEAHIAAIAHPLLESRNLLRPSRLVAGPEYAAGHG